MKWASGEVVGILTFLLPGFVAAAIFYSLTSYPKSPSGDFERRITEFSEHGQVEWTTTPRDLDEGERVAVEVLASPVASLGGSG